MAGLGTVGHRPIRRNRIGLLRRRLDRAGAPPALVGLVEYRYRFGQASAARILRLLCASSSCIAFDMTDSAKARAPILAAGGILLREGSRPRIAVVRLRRDKSWVMPKGKLY